MGAEAELLSREAFRSSVLERDGGRCVLCGATAVDAHHILERRLWPDGGYYLDNGASVCGRDHLRCEATEVSVEELRQACGIRRAHLPPHLYADHRYDKWGNPILEDGSRLRGELFHDGSVQKVLASGGVLGLFRPWCKYPRTHHLPWSPGMHEDDRRMESLDGLKGRRVIATEKMDGENTSLYHDHVHARSLDGPHHPSRDWVKQFWSRIRLDIPVDWRVCGENLYARHSIGYAELDSYFLGFSIWNERNECLDWDETLEWFDLLGIRPVSVLYDGPFDEPRLRALQGPEDWDRHEGYVVRAAERFAYGEFRHKVGKFVRTGHAGTVQHWMRGAVLERNHLRQEPRGEA